MNADDTSIEDEFADLTAASQSSLGYWDNPIDDEDWNDANPE